MSRIKGTKHSAALIVAVIALVAALGGGAVAGVTISKLNKREKNQVKRIAERKAKRLDNKIQLLPGPQGLQGDTGPQGPQGPKGDQGASGLVDIQLVSGTTRVETADMTDNTSPSVECPDGYTVIGGGATPTFSVGSERWVMRRSAPVEAGQGVFVNDGWIASFETLDGKDADGTYGFSAKAICAKTSD